MVGLFAKWQPAYEEAGLAVFPVDGDAKKPLVGRYLNLGTRNSRQLAEKFASARALGFACGATGRGRRTAITVLDIDEPDENLLADAFSILGRSPVVIRTASGKFHAWYGSSGERRLIKKVIPGRAVDILGHGFALAPPSQTAKGEYEFVEGSLADIETLPTLTLPEPPTEACSTQIVRASEPREIEIGMRNDSLWRACMAKASSCHSIVELRNFAVTFNSGLQVPLPSTEVETAVGSAWARTEAGENWFGSGRRLVLKHEVLDCLLKLGPDPVALMMFLLRTHWARDKFFVANAMAEAMPGGAWSIKRFAAARAALLQAGMLVEISPPSRANGAARYAFGKNALN